MAVALSEVPNSAARRWISAASMLAARGYFEFIFGEQQVSGEEVRFAFDG